jgi:transcriptional regulator with XRE-family HTH domain
MAENPTVLSGRAMPKKVEPASAFGKRLMQMRMDRGLTQIELGKLIGASQRAVSRYETVAELPPAHIIIKLAKALKVSADELLGLQLPKAQPKPKKDPQTTRLWKKFQQIQRLPVKDQRAVIRLVNSLVTLNRSA